MARIISMLRWVFEVGITIGLMGGVLPAALFLLGFISGRPLADTFCAAAAALSYALIALMSLAVASGIIVIYLDPTERHVFRVKED